MAKGQKEPQVTQATTQTPQQQALLNQLLQGYSAAIQGFPLGEMFGGPVESSWSPLPFGQSMGERTGITRKQPRKSVSETRPNKGAGKARGYGRRGYDEDIGRYTELLTEGMVEPFREGMTGNFPRRV